MEAAACRQEHASLVAQQWLDAEKKRCASPCFACLVLSTTIDFHCMYSFGREGIQVRDFTHEVQGLDRIQLKHFRVCKAQEQIKAKGAPKNQRWAWQGARAALPLLSANASSLDEALIDACNCHFDLRESDVIITAALWEQISTFIEDGSSAATGTTVVQHTDSRQYLIGRLL